jgi:acid stress-induced BolA-like protein IbaG/YrbA
MTANDVKALLDVAFENADISVTGEGANFQLSIVSDVFADKRAVARQQMVYAVLNDQIASGDIHAVTMTLKTLNEAA